MGNEKTDTQVMFKIPEEVVRAQVAAAVISALREHGPMLIEKLVTDALNAPKKDSYGRAEQVYINGKYQEVGHFASMVNDAIRKTALDEAQAWLTDREADIRKATRSMLDKGRARMVSEIVEGVVDQLAKARPSVEIHLSLPDSRKSDR